MKSALQTTLLMGILAAATSAVAMYYLPTVETITAGEMEGKPLFEEYSSNKVRAIEVSRFNSDKNTLEQVKLRRRGERWVFPENANYVATNAQQIALAINSLMDRTVFEEKSSNKEDHILYGVVDPEDYQTVKNRSSLGSKIILRDQNQQPIGSLIIGLGVKDDTQRQKRFVRIPDEPQVYVIDFNVASLASEFFLWNTPNLFNIRTQGNPAGLNFESLEIESYIIDQANIAQPNAKQSKYRASLVAENNQLVPKSFEIPNEQGEYTDAQITPEQISSLQIVQQFLARIIYADVLKKDKNVAKQLARLKPELSDADYKSLNSFGFAKADSDDNSIALNGLGGTVSVKMQEGIVIKLHIGAISGADKIQPGKIANLVMMRALVDEANFPEPEKPADLQEGSDEEKDYLRALEKRNDDLKAARQAATDLNRSYADWYYEVGEEITSGIRPELNITQIVSGPAKEDATEDNPEKSESETESDSDEEDK